MSHRESVSDFWGLVGAGRSAALDLDVQTGRLFCRCTENLKTGERGNGAVPAVYSDDWVRVVSCENGVVSGVGCG